MSSKSLLFSIAALCGVLHSASLSAKQAFSIERSWQLQRIGNPVVSPDGRTIVAPVARIDMEADKSLVDLYLWHTDGSVERAFTTNASNEASPAFSPDGRWLAFTAQRDDDKAAQVYVMPITGGEARRLTQLPTGAQSLKWFPDNQHIGFVARVFADLPLDKQAEQFKARSERKMTGQVWDAGPVTAWDQFLDERQFHVFQVNLDGKITALTLGTGLELPRGSVQGTDSTYAIAPDGQQIAFVADSDASRSASNLDVFTLDIASKTPRNLTSANAASDSAPLYSPNGRFLSFSQQRIKGFYADKARLMLHERSKGNTRELFEAFDRSVGDVVWAADSSKLYAAIDDAGTVRAYELPLTAKPRAITAQSSFSALALAGKQLVGLRQSFIEPPTLVRIDPKTGSASKLSTLNDALLADTALGSFESVTYTGANGKPIQMWVNYPAGFDRSKRYPLFMLIHGGPHNAITNSMQWRWNAQVFGSWGYVTAWPNFHGSSGFGQAFTDSINPEWAEQPYQDVIKAAEHLASQPYIDADRMVAGGGSYGGYLASVILGRKHPFKALVAHAAVYNLYTQYGADFATELPRFGPFWSEQNRSVLERNSPHLAAANFKTPTLVVHGQTDLRVPVNHGLELYHTLLMKNVPSRLLYYPNENHWVLKPQNSVFWYQEVKRWFEQHNPAP